MARIRRYLKGNQCQVKEVEKLHLVVIILLRLYLAVVYREVNENWFYLLPSSIAIRTQSLSPLKLLLLSQLLLDVGVRSWVHRAIQKVHLILLVINLSLHYIIYMDCCLIDCKLDFIFREICWGKNGASISFTLPRSKKSSLIYIYLSCFLVECILVYFRVISVLSVLLLIILYAIYSQFSMYKLYVLGD